MGSPKYNPPNKKTRLKVIIDSNFRCFYCNCIIYLAGDGSGINNKNTATVDHKIPQSKGGTNDYFNLVACCWGCNSAKKDLTMNEFLLHKLQ